MEDTLRDIASSVTKPKLTTARKNMLYDLDGEFARGAPGVSVKVAPESAWFKPGVVRLSVNARRDAVFTYTSSEATLQGLQAALTRRSALINVVCSRKALKEADVPLLPILQESAVVLYVVDSDQADEYIAALDTNLSAALPTQVEHVAKAFVLVAPDAREGRATRNSNKDNDAAYTAGRGIPFARQAAASLLTAIQEVRVGGANPAFDVAFIDDDMTHLEVQKPASLNLSMLQGGKLAQLVLDGDDNVALVAFNSERNKRWGGKGSGDKTASWGVRVDFHFVVARWSRCRGAHFLLEAAKTMTSQQWALARRARCAGKDGENVQLSFFQGEDFAFCSQLAKGYGRGKYACLRLNCVWARTNLRASVAGTLKLDKESVSPTRAKVVVERTELQEANNKLGAQDLGALFANDDRVERVNGKAITGVDGDADVNGEPVNVV